jgi:UDP-N-acetylmuramate dehydrogenase
MKRHTTFRIGGPAAMFIEPASVSQLHALARFLHEKQKEGFPWMILGNGSNLLVRDEGYPGAVIHLGPNFSSITSEPGGRIRCQCGAMLMTLSRYAAENSLTGLEFACGIPGSVGGAIFMNAGAYGGEIANVLGSVTYLSFEEDDVKLKTADPASLDFSYRHSKFHDIRAWIVEATFQLQPGDRAESLAQMEQLLASRREKQPLEFPSAGSTFKRPQGSYASMLVDQCGLKGFTVGGAQVSEKHAGFVINKGDATCADVLELMKQVKEIVYNKTGYVLEPEVEIV